MKQHGKSSLSLLAPPYRHILPVPPEEAFPNDKKLLWGAALIWHIQGGDETANLAVVRSRPASLPLMVILPTAARVQQHADLLLQVTESARPSVVLPHHSEPDPEELSGYLSDVPSNFAVELVEYLRWRKIHMTSETRHTIMKICELAEYTTTLSGLCRSLYVSRRALGRRFRNAGLPVPSHWLQFCRLLHASLRLQNSGGTLFEISRRFNYADGFTLSNQMYRLTGLRPSIVRAKLGWEWIVEAWLEAERASGKLSIPTTQKGTNDFQEAWRRPRLCDGRPLVR